MRDCSNVTMRDVLPDLLHGRLTEARAAEVRAHVDSCEDCRAELALLTVVRGVSVARRVDVARIVASLPAYRARPFWRRALASRPLRVAAAVVLLAGGASLMFDARRDSRSLSTMDTMSRLALTTLPELALGETFQDVSDSDLRALVDELGSLEAVMSEEPDERMVTAPVIDGGGL